MAGKLERARIHVLKNDNSTPNYVVEVCFNPKEYSLDKSVTWDDETAKNDAAKPDFKKPSAMSLSVTLQFDSYEERANVRDKWVRLIEKAALMMEPVKDQGKKTKPDPKKNRPPVIIFQWGRFIFKGVIESLSQKYTMFLSDGTPVRAEVALKIRNVLDEKIDDDKSTLTDKDQETEDYAVQDNDRLDLIAAKKLGDAGRWAEIAAMNDISDPVSMDGKKTLVIPKE